MRTATTKEFRNAVRLAASSLKGYVQDSWTDAPGNNTYNDLRYVGFLIRDARSEDVAAKAEQLLNAVGATAATRAPYRASKGPMAVYRRSINYVRGTCVIG